VAIRSELARGRISVIRQAYRPCCAVPHDDAALAKFAKDPATGCYLIGGELVVLRNENGALQLQPLFAMDEVRAFDGARETVVPWPDGRCAPVRHCA